MKAIKEMTIDEVIEARIKRAGVADNMEAIVSNSINVKENRKITNQIVAITNQIVAITRDLNDPYDNPNVAFDLKDLIDLVNAVSEEK